jgi:hypothetical protein
MDNCHIKFYIKTLLIDIAVKHKSKEMSYGRNVVIYIFNLQYKAQ